MARKIDTTKPLSAEDVAWLMERRPVEYVERMISLAGGIEPEEADNSPEKDEGGSDLTDAPESTEDAGDGSEEAPTGAEGEADEDLIGGEGIFDVIGSTESEVKSWAEDASDEDKASALATEQDREDRDPRKGVISVLS